MAKTGVNAFDSLPSRIGFVDIDALRALYMNTQHPGFLEQFFSRVGLRPISKRLKEMREGSHRFAITLKFTHRFHILWDTDIPIFEAALRELKDEGWKP